MKRDLDETHQGVYLLSDELVRLLVAELEQGWNLEGGD